MQSALGWRTTALRWGTNSLQQSRISSSELYRRLLNLMVARLRHSREEIADPKAYPSAGEFESDLSLIRESLAVNRGQRLAELVMDPLLRQVRTFGFHLSTLDLRQHARVHAQAMAEIESNGISASTQDVLDTFREIAKLKKAYPACAIRSLHHQRSRVGSGCLRGDQTRRHLRRANRRLGRRSGTHAGAAF